MTDDWGETNVGQLGRVVTGKTPPTARTELFGDAYPFITPTDIDGSCHTVKTERFLSDLGREYQETLLLPPEAVCFVAIGATIGKICVTDRPSFTNQQINSVIVDRERHHPRFVYHLLRYEAASIKSIAGGAATPIVNKTVFSNHAVRVPSLPTQRKIAAILSAYDDLIENNTRRIKILEEMAQALYREWFVNFRFPGHEKVKMVASPLGPIPQGWQMVRLGSVTDVNALSIKNGDEPEYINYIDISSVSPGRIDKVEHLPCRDAPGRARRIVRHGDMIWSTVRPNRRSYSLILDPLPDLIVSTGFAVISPRDVPFSYVYHALTTQDFVGYLTNHARGSAYPAVNGGDFEGADFLLPEPKVVADFHKVTGGMLIQCQTLIRQNANLRRTRDLLLPKLISGEIDVSNFDTRM
jgi:type I restriction enzyme S subunit